MDYPKKPTGPSGFGEAGVRRLQSEGGTFQRSRPEIGVEAKLSGDFSRVTVEGAEYVVIGDHGAGFKTRQVQRYIMPFMPSISAPPSLNMGKGRYARWVDEGADAEENLTYTYTISLGVTRDYTVRHFYGDRAVGSGGFYGGGTQFGTVSYEVYVPTGVTTYFQKDPSLALTRPADPHTDAQQLASFMLGNGGRVDTAGRLLQDLFIISYYKDYPAIARLINPTFTRPDAEFSPAIPMVVTKNITYAMLAENFFKATPYPDAAAGPKVFLFWAVGHNLTTPSAADVTSILTTGRVEAEPTGSIWDPVNGNSFNAALSVTMTTMKTVALPDDWMLVFFRLYCDDAGVKRWRSRIARFQYSGGLTGALVVDEELPSDADGIYYQSAVHLGENHVLAKKVLGFNGIDFDAKLSRSTDGGLTWEEMPFIGIHAPAKNQYLGDLTVHASRKDGEPGIVLMTAWDATALAYYVYESRNDGTSWVRKGRIYKPDTFRRVDSMVVGDGGGNFETLVPGPNPARPVDITILDRYSPAE